MVARTAPVKLAAMARAKGSHLDVERADFTEDRIYGGRVIIRQPRQGYRVNVDTILLAAAVAPAQSPARFAELGCGVGAALLAVAANNQDAAHEFVGVERDPVYARLARENAEANGLADRMGVVEADALDLPDSIGRFDRVLFNPPFDYEWEGHPPTDARRAAHVADRPLGDWIKVWSNRLRGEASLVLIHRPQRLPEILAGLDGRLGAIEVLPIRPNAQSEARRVIVRARKGSRAPLKLLPGLDLHPVDGSTAKHTPEAEAILRGETALSFG